ncbi:MAG: hypothetical protein LKM30_03740 [Bacilli bacterium]|jgi:hypothetical protein|nr:hypothetical protein [Bacilli bacterium]
MFEKMKLPVVKIVFLCLLGVYTLLMLITIAGNMSGSNAGYVVGGVLRILVLLTLFGLTIFTTATGLKNYSNFLLAVLFVYFLVNNVMDYGSQLGALNSGNGFLTTLEVFGFLCSTALLVVAVLQTLDYNIAALDFTKIILILLFGIACLSVLSFIFDILYYASINADNSYYHVPWTSYVSGVNSYLIFPSTVLFGFLFYKRSNPKIHNA